MILIFATKVQGCEIMIRQKSWKESFSRHHLFFKKLLLFNGIFKKKFSPFKTEVLLSLLPQYIQDCLVVHIGYVLMTSADFFHSISDHLMLKIHKKYEWYNKKKSRNCNIQIRLSKNCVIHVIQLLARKFNFFIFPDFFSDFFLIFLVFFYVIFPVIF